ncbi:aminoacyl-tRNA hydrolase [Carboxydothermus pertinax]|uniref:Peptidyl-tRNA hydrolase n=1 Tax=Carboxydothermus pertinax TaxID=870242 RepID=A0A1L8CVA2_9THEO|nr:aminoacyl-tRNA hydrolase [Carboxydothermus pertinax]GAV22794.1 peptidyl-tRNA hydrolase [Carboxydothermus pertinax]
MFIITGLGNPGREYENTRHNAGFMVVDGFAEKFGIPITKKKFKSLVGEGEIFGEKVLLLKPQTYMNLSGTAVQEAVFFYKLPLSRLIVVYDDLDLPLGKIRLRLKGSAGGHRGMGSIISCLGCDEIPRLKIGIGRPAFGDVKDYVLEPFTREEREILEPTLKFAVEALAVALKEGFNKAMNDFNRGG